MSSPTRSTSGRRQASSTVRSSVFDQHDIDGSDVDDSDDNGTSARHDRLIATDRESGPRRVVRASFAWRWVFPVVLIVTAVVAYRLARSGYTLVVESDEGAVVEEFPDDPTAPGFRASIEPTRTMVIFETGPSGDDPEALVGVQVVSLDSAGGGAVVVVPPALVFELTDGTVVDLREAFADGGADAAVAGLESLFKTRFTDPAAVLDPERFESIVAGLAPLEFDLADALVYDGAGGDRVALEPGRHDLTAEQIVLVNRVLGPDERPTNLLLRQRDLWGALMSALPDSDIDDVVPPGDDGLFYAIRQLALGAPRVQALSATVYEPPAGGFFFVVSDEDRESLSELVAAIIPLPTDPGNGVRTGVALLTGTGNDETRRAAIPLLVAAGAEISVVGNAESFEVTASRVEYHLAEAVSAAEDMATAIGAPAPEFVEQVDPVAPISVVIGADFVPTVN